MAKLIFLLCLNLWFTTLFYAQPGSMMFCQGASTAILQAPGGYTSYSWTAPGTSSLSASQASLATITISNPIIGNVYTVNLISSSSVSSSAIYTLAYTSVSIASLSSGATCIGGNGGYVSVIGAGSLAGYNYTWTNSANVLVGSASTTSNLAVGIYNVTLTAAGPQSLTCGAATSSISINATTTPFDYTVNVLPSPTICYGNSVYVPLGFTSVPQPGQYAYSWFPSNYITSSANGGQAISISPIVPPGPPTILVYTVTVSRSNCYITKTLTVTTINPITPTISSVPPIFCSDGQPYSVTFTPQGGIFSGSGAINAAGIITPSLSVGLNTFSYSMVQEGCSSSATASFTIFPKPMLNILGNSTLCSGDSVTLSAYGANSYSWNINSTNTTVVIASGSPTLISVTGWDTNGCTSTITKTLSTAQTPTINVAGGLTVCKGSSSTMLATGAVTYTWSNNLISPVVSISPTATTVYSVVGSDITGQCFDTAMVTITVVPVPTISVLGDEELCVNNSATLTVIGANDYTWNTGLTGSVIIVSPTTTTSYSVAGTSIYGCTAFQTHIIETSLCTDVNSVFNNDAADILFYPNPTTACSFFKVQEAMYMTIYDTRGKFIMEKYLEEGNQQLCLENRIAGLYYVILVNQREVRKIKLLKLD